MYWIPTCSTCQKALDYLLSHNVEVERYRNLKTEPLSREEVQHLAGLVGGPPELFSKQARKYRSMGLAGKEVSGEDMLTLMANEYTFIKRPVIVDGDRAVAGFSKKRYEEFLGRQA